MPLVCSPASPEPTPHLLWGTVTLWATVHPPSAPQGQVPDNQGQPLHPTAHGNDPSELTLSLLTRPCLLLPTEAAVKVKALAVCSPRSLCLLANGAPSLRGPVVRGLETHYLYTSSPQSRLDLLQLSTTKACVLPVLSAFVRRLPPQSHAFHDGNSRGLKQAQTLLGVGLCSLLYPCLCPHETVSEQGERVPGADYGGGSSRRDPVFSGCRTDSPASGPGSRGTVGEAGGGEIPAVPGAWLPVGAGGLDATSLGKERLLSTAGAGAVGGTYPRGMPGAGKR